MTVVRLSRIFGGGMTLQADAVGGGPQLGAVRLMTIAAGDAGLEHPALLERAVIVDLVEHLPVRVIKALPQRRDRMSVGQRAAGDPVLGEAAAERMAQTAGFDLLANQRRREVACGVARPRIDRPDDVATLVEPHEQPFGRVFALAERPPALARGGPGDVPRSLSVAGLAAHADFRKAGGEAIVGCVVVLAHAGGMALGAHEVPVLVQPGPMQDVVVLDLFIRVQVEPALAALVLRPAVPGDRQRLQAAIGKLDEILLQRIDAERVFDLEGGKLAVGAVGLHEEFPVLAEEARTDAVIVEARIVEVAEHRRLGGMLHREPMLRSAPQLRLRLVAAGASPAAGERCGPFLASTGPWRERSA